MSVGFIILAHDAPDQVATLARHLVGQGAPVVVHLDRRAGVHAELTSLLADTCTVISTQRSEWGMFGLVAASLDAARVLLEQHGDLGHVMLLSGNCLPLRPLSELEGFLADHADASFIESMSAAGWVQGGLDLERFTFYHPFAWKRQRWAFDMSVEIQRWAGVARRMPDGLVAHLGLQWWCLTAESLRAVLRDPRLPGWTRFFRRTWIPDEGFFQTILRRADASGRIFPQSLTLSRFAVNGLPFVFHDDHQPMLAASDFFFARKIDPDAHRLREWAFGATGRGEALFAGRVDESVFTGDTPPDGAEHVGIQMAGRFPRGTGVMRPDTARPYTVIASRDADLIQTLRERLLPDLPKTAFHGRLFHPEGAEFAGGGDTYTGNLSGLASQRNYRPEQFLAHLIWADRDQPVAFTLHADDSWRIAHRVWADANARMVLIGDRPLSGLPDGGPQPEGPVLNVDATALRAELEGAPAGPLARIAAFILGLQDAD